jgi:ribosomal protein S18 acetylase RimI-like enzyme
MSNINYSTIKDAEEIEILRGRSSFKYVFDPAAIESLKKHFTSKNSLYVLAKSDGIFAGFCSIDRDWWEENHFFIREILVDPGFQKLGIGSELMRRCIDHARKLGAMGVVTETAFDNVPMQTLCAKLGFQKWDNPQWKEGITYKLLF